MTEELPDNEFPKDASLDAKPVAECVDQEALEEQWAAQDAKQAEICQEYKRTHP